MRHRIAPTAQAQIAWRPPADESRRGEDPAPGPPGTLVVHAASDFDAMVEVLQRPEAPLPALALRLCADVDAPSLSRLLVTLDDLFHAGRLQHLSVQALGPLNDALRLALASSLACLVLSSHARQLILRDPSLARRHRGHLPLFLATGLVEAGGKRLCLSDAQALAELGVKHHEDALLRAVAVLAPHYQWRFYDLPEDTQYERMVSVGLPCSVNLRVLADSVPAMAEWLSVARPTLQAIELDLRESLDADNAMLLWTRVAGQGSVQRLELVIGIDIHVAWADRSQAALAPVLRLNLLHVRLCDWYTEAPPFVSELMEWLQPLNVVLQSDTRVPVRATLETLQPQRQRPLDSLVLITQRVGQPQPQLDGAMLSFVKRFDRVRRVSEHMDYSLGSTEHLQPVKDAADENLLLGTLEWVSCARERFASTHRYHKPLWVGLRRGHFFEAFTAGGVGGFGKQHLPLPPDIAERLLQGAELNPREGLALSLVSPDTHHAAMQHRRELQAQVLAQALRDGLLDAASLRELLQQPSGEPDEPLTAALSQQLLSAREDPATWRVFDEASALR